LVRLQPNLRGRWSADEPLVNHKEGSTWRTVEHTHGFFYKELEELSKVKLDFQILISPLVVAKYNWTSAPRLCLNSFTGMDPVVLANKNSGAHTSHEDVDLFSKTASKEISWELPWGSENIIILHLHGCFFSVAFAVDDQLAGDSDTARLESDSA